MTDTKPAQKSAVEELERKFESARQYRLRCAASPDTYENLAMTAVECAQAAFYLRAYTRHAKELDALRAELAALRSGDMVMVPRKPSVQLEIAFGDLGDGYRLTAHQVKLLYFSIIAAVEEERRNG